MTDETRARLIHVMNTLHMVIWDRCTRQTVEGNTNVVAYGWIPRPDGKRDFVVVETWDSWDTVTHTSSSAFWSRSISTLLYGNADEENHHECERIADVFGEAVEVLV